MSANPPGKLPDPIGHYQLLETIGRGGMGLVYRARDTRLDRLVAIKCLRTELFEAHYVERFKREALLLAKLNHPNIVQIYDFVEAPEQLALVMELVPGSNLQQHLREHLVPLRQRVQWLSQIAQGLAVAHDAGIIHRDLKAENILINTQLQAKITDLGIAKSQDFNGTLTDHIAGSYGSMSPEQAMGESLDFRSDLFSLGILAYQLVCGAHPFGDSNNKLQLMQRIISHPASAPLTHNPDLPGELVQLLGQLLCKNPDNRPDSTHWVAAQFDQISQLLSNTPAADDTQLLNTLASAPGTSGRTSGTGRSQPQFTRDHPTFDTRFTSAARVAPASYSVRLQQAFAANKVSVAMAGLSLLILLGLLIWQLQPKPPTYVAVIPPSISTQGMQPAQQALIQLAVEDAIQQSLLALDNYHLIPRSDIKDANGDNQAILRATNADELITASIDCTAELCHISLARLTRESDQPQARLSTRQSKRIDVLTDNYLVMASLVYKNTERMYRQQSSSHYQQLAAEDYNRYLHSYQRYLAEGASTEALAELAAIKNLNTFVEAQTLYRDISLDLFYETAEPRYLTQLEQLLGASEPYNSNNIQHLLNRFYLAASQQQDSQINEVIGRIKAADGSADLVLSLEAYAALEQNNYRQAIDQYQQLLKLKPSATNHHNIATAYWYSGALDKAKGHLQLALEKSPNSYKTNQINATIALSNGDAELAINSFSTIIEKNPNTIDLNNLGVAYLLARQPDQALDYFEQALTLAPDSCLTLLNLGDAHSIKGTPQARDYYTRVLEQIDDSQGSVDDLKCKSLALAHMARPAEAINLLKKIEQLDGQSLDTTYTAATVYTLAGEKISALLHIEQALAAGLNYRWFSFPWFQPLCAETQFNTLLNNSGASQGCPALVATH